MQSVVQFYLLRLSQENFTGTQLVVVTIEIQRIEEVTYICLGTVKTVPQIHKRYQNHML
jgi:hypothetical protein